MVSTSTPDHQAPRILVVDGDDGTGDSIRAVLGAQGYAVKTARDGRAAIEAMRAGRIDVAIVAILRHGVLEAGMHFLEKPFTPRVLAGKVREVLDAP